VIALSYRLASGRSRHKSCFVPVTKEEEAMLNLLWAVAVILAILWMLGFALHFTMGGLVHLLLVLAVIAVLARIIMGRRIV
jgi:hypothetical protein